MDFHTTTLSTRPSMSVIVCAYNEEALLPGCLHAILAQTRLPDEIIVVNNASTDRTGEVARAIAGVRVVDEPAKGLVVARETGRLAARGDLLAYVDADCRPPIFWLERVEAAFRRRPAMVGLTGPYRFYDWDWIGRALIRAYDCVVAPPTHFVVHHLLGIGAIFYGGNFTASAKALNQIGGFDRTIEFHGEDTNVGRRLTAVGLVTVDRTCWLWTSARRYRAMGRGAVFRLYVRNFWSEVLRHRPADRHHQDVRI
jgi:glycosyltransferase involved in cell wall biosynthesis